jgi:hypothetical protein
MYRPLLILLSGLVVLPASAAEPPAVNGTWQKHEHAFSFTGFTSHYSCVGLETKMKTLLGLVGARPDFRVAGTCADAPGAPTLIQVVRLSFHTLAPAGAPAANAAGAEPGQGEWREVNWGPTAPRELQAGDCELVEQFAQEILPLFTTRDLENHMNCQPRQAQLSGIHLKFSVLGAAPAARHAAVAKTQ